MTNLEIHNELSAIGLSSEVHALVDDLDLDFAPAPLWFSQMLRKRRKKPLIVSPFHRGLEPSLQDLYLYQNHHRNVHPSYPIDPKKTGRLL